EPYDPTPTQLIVAPLQPRMNEVSHGHQIQPEHDRPDDACRGQRLQAGGQGECIAEEREDVTNDRHEPREISMRPWRMHRLAIAPHVQDDTDEKAAAPREQKPLLRLEVFPRS